MKSLQEEQGPVDLRIVNELVDLTPEHWHSAVLEIQHALVSDGKESLRLSIKSPEGEREFLEPTETLFDAARELVALTNRYGHHLRRATYITEMTTDGDWDFTAKYEYREE